MKKIFWMVGLVLLTGARAAAQQDTMRMQVTGTSAAFSFEADKDATYRVIWGDGADEKYEYTTTGAEHELTHTYATEGTYNIVFYCEKEPEPTNYVEPIYNIDMVWVKGGSFMMGCTAEQGDGCTETPHKVTLDGFYIGKYEITQAQWKAVMGTAIKQQASENEFGVGDRYPMYYVSWNEAKEFCEKLSQKTGKNYVLPTEAQWEFAARGGVKSQHFKYSGDNTLKKVAWCDENSSYCCSHTVGGFTPNELGIYDMSGNVQEWCADWYSRYINAEVTNPTGPDSGTGRVRRGGSWDGYGLYECRVSARADSKPDYDNYFIGFRVVCLPQVQMDQN